MASAWLTIVGLGEDGADGLGTAARDALANAETVIGPPRHVSLLPALTARTVPWPVPFSDGLPLLLEHRGQPTVALASGDPFWFGAGRVIAETLAFDEWTAIPGPSVFSLAAARLGWPLETTVCLGLHAAPLSRLRPHLAAGVRILATLRDGEAVADLGAWCATVGEGAARIHVLEALGGPRERITASRADALVPARTAPVTVAIEPEGAHPLPLAPGRPDTTYDSDGQITKAPIRAMTLAALAPKPGEHLWDIGGGSGSISLEWLLCHPTLSATSVERNPDRAARIRANAAALGQDRLCVVEGAAPAALAGLTPPDAIFVGGGLGAPLLSDLRARAPGARLVANAVTLETQALILSEHARTGGALMRVTLETPAPVGTFTAWSPARPVLQWSTTL